MSVPPAPKKHKVLSVPSSPSRESDSDSDSEVHEVARVLEDEFKSVAPAKDEFKAQDDIVPVRIVTKTVTLWKKRTTVPFNLPRGSWTKVVDIYGRPKRPPVLGQGMVCFSWQVH